MALSFNGTSDYAVTASSLTMSNDKFAISWWVYIDSTTNSDSIMVEFWDGVGAVSNFWTSFAKAGGAAEHWVHHNGNVGTDAQSISDTDWGYNAWHHVVVNHDISIGAAGGEIPTVYVDASSKTLTNEVANNNTTFNGTWPINLARRGDGSLFLKGRLAEVAIYSGINLSGADVASLYNSGSGALATSVQSGSLTNYWQLCSDGTATTGGVNMTVSGATQVTHPVSLCAGGSSWGGLTGDRLNRLVRIP